MDDPNQEPTQESAQELAEDEPVTLEIDSDKLELYIAEQKMHQSLPMGFLGGVIGAVVGAAIWAAITVSSGYQIGFMAIGVGFLVGALVRVMGKGLEKPFGIIGASFALIGCLAGNILSGCGFEAADQNVSFFQVVASLTPEIALDILKYMFSPVDLLFYGIAIYEGYRFAFRQFTHEELAELAEEQPNDPPPDATMP